MSSPLQPAGGPAPAPPDRWLRRPHRSEGSPGRVPDLGRILLGLVVVSLGSLFLLDSAGALDAGRAIDRWWPVVIVAAGALTLAERPRSLVQPRLAVPRGVADGHLRWHHARPARRGPGPLGCFGQRHGRPRRDRDPRPPGWRISTRSTPILGGLEDKTDRTTAPAADAPMLHVDAVAILGGVEIKHDEDD